MSGLDKILQEIGDEAAAEASQLLAKAKEKADGILAEAKAESDAKVSRIEENARQDVADIESARQSALALQRRQRTLETKQQLLAETLDKALAALHELEPKEYFALLLRLAAKNAEPGQGEMLLNEKDLARKPADFEKELAKSLPPGCALKVSANTRPIDGGFVLSYGGVEENCSFTAIFDARREEFHDLIRGILFPA